MGMLIQQLQLAQTLEHHHTAETLPSTAETIPENQPERDSRTSDNITSREASPPPSCIDHEDIEIGPKPEEEHNKLLEAQNMDRTIWSNRNSNPDPSPEPDIDMERGIDSVRQKQQLEQQHRESKGVIEKGSKRVNGSIQEFHMWKMWKM